MGAGEPRRGRAVRAARRAAPRARRARRAARRRRLPPGAATVYGDDRAAGGLRDDGAPDDRDPRRGPLVRIVGVHVRDGRLGVRRRASRSAASPWPRCRGSGARLLVAVLWLSWASFAALYFALETGPVLGARAALAVPRSGRRSFPAYYTAAFAGLVLVIGPAVALSGAVLPLLFHALRREFGELGAQAGRLYSLEHARVARGRADRRLRAVLLARPAPGVPRGGRRARARGGGRDAARGCRASGMLGAGAALVAALLLVGSFAPVATSPTWSRARFASARPKTGAIRGHRRCRTTSWEARCSTTTIRTARSRCCRSSTRGRDSRSIIVNGKSDGNTAADYADDGARGARAGAVHRAHGARVRDRLRHRGLRGRARGARGSEERDGRRDLARCDRSRAALRRGQRRRLDESEDPDRAQRRLSRAARGAAQLRRDRLRAEQPVGHRRGDAVLARVPRRGARPAHARRACTASGTTSTRRARRRSSSCCGPTRRCSITWRSGR